MATINRKTYKFISYARCFVKSNRYLGAENSLQHDLSCYIRLLDSETI